MKQRNGWVKNQLYICIPCGSEHTKKENIQNKGKCRFCSTNKKLTRIN